MEVSAEDRATPDRMEEVPSSSIERLVQARFRFPGNVRSPAVPAGARPSIRVDSAAQVSPDQSLGRSM